jgi:ABC-2 type transport system permease protein
MGSAFLAVGTFATTVTENQIVAALITGVVLLGLWIIGWPADTVGGAWARVLTHLSVPDHIDNFAKGVLDTKDVIYFLNVTLIGLFLALKSLEARRWKG